MSTFTEVQHQELIHECMEWEMALNAWKDKISDLRNELYVFAAGKVDSEIRIGIEHFHNQLHIQQINIHDLLHELNTHMDEANEHPEFKLREPHNDLKEKFQALLKSLESLESEFSTFTK
jgi:hypothetical protein